jgi:ribosomal protein S18 acetylase RimI-like enzyme
MAFEVCTYTPALADALEALQRRYIAADPKGCKFVPVDFYWDHPSMERGANVFCACDRGELVGYGALIPTPAEPDSDRSIPNTIWIHIRAAPQRPDTGEIQETLFKSIQERSRHYSRRWRGRRTRLAISYPEARADEIEFFRRQGLEPYDALLQMRRDLSVPLPPVPVPAGVVARRWAIETLADKERYVAAEAQAFPHNPRTVQALDFYMGSWQGGTPVTAFDGHGEIAGSVMAYWYSTRMGVTEDVFVLPGWRRRGIGRYLLAQAIEYLVENGIAYAYLEVRESNRAAIRLYSSLGYLVANREERLGIYL